MTLMIADDDPVVRSMLSMSLAQQFAVIAAAKDSEEAVAIAGANQPDAAVVDVDMPAGGGPRAVRGILEVSPRTAIVVLSADESDGIVRDLLQAGAIAYRRKGGGTQELAETLERSVKIQRQQVATSTEQAAS